MNIEERIEELLSKMTLHEKVGQLHQVAPSKVGDLKYLRRKLLNYIKAVIWMRRHMMQLLITRC